MRIKKYLTFAADFETTVYEGQEYTEVWASGLCRLGSEDVKIFHSIDDTFEYLKSLRCNCLLYYHNLKFDGTFWLSYLLDVLHFDQAYDRIGDSAFEVKFQQERFMRNNTFKYSISDRGQWYSIIIKVNHRFIEIRDSLKLLPFSLKAIGKSFKTKHQKLDMEYKGFRYLIESARYLDDRYVIVITGEGPLTKQLKKQAAELSASVGHGSGKTCAKIVFAGLISDEELLAYLHACDVFCFPSITKNEAFGIALAEAMYCAKPVVTNSIEGSGVNYVSIGGVTGIECPNKDSRSYARAIQELGENPDLRERYGQAGKRRVEEYFLYEQFADHIRSLFESL